MGRAVSFMVDEKAADVECERFLDMKYDPALLEDDASSIGTRKSSLNYLREHLPSIKDIFKLVLFCTVTVVGMNFISGAIPSRGWHNKPEAGHADHGYLAVDKNTCQSSVDGTNLSMDFTDPTKFAFSQLSQELFNHPNHIYDSVRTTGSIEVRSTEKSSGSYVHVDLDIRGSDSRLTSSDALGIAKTDSSLIVKTPKRLQRGLVPDGATPRPCIHVSAVITIAVGAKLENLNIHSQTLSVTFQPGLDYAESRVVETKTHFDSVSTYSRETVINVESASVTGSYPLYDLLSIHTNSGSINVETVPKNASRQIIKPAVLRLSSNSGSVRARTSTISVPDRDYQTSISTSSGSIEAGILHGLRTSLRSINGRVSAELYPYGHNDSRTDVESHCTSGSTDITLHSSLSHPTAPLKKLYGYYRGVSGSLSFYYPAQWQGTVKGNTLSGGVHLDWQGLRVVKDEKDGWVKRRIEAVRGDGEGVLEFHSASGSVRLSGASGGL